MILIIVFLIYLNIFLNSPPFLSRVMNSDLASWGSGLHLLWKKLGRKISIAVNNHQEKYSQLYVRSGVIVPGGRFR